MKTKLFLYFAMMLIWQNVIASDFSAVAPSGQTMYYNIVNGKAELTHPGYSWQNFTKPTGDLIIPENVVHNGVVYEVTEIGQSALDGCSGLTSVTIPRTVTSIIYNSFWGCTGLTSVAFNADSCNVLGGGPTYYSPFEATSLTTMTFGNDTILFVQKQNQLDYHYYSRLGQNYWQRCIRRMQWPVINNYWQSSIIYWQ